MTINWRLADRIVATLEEEIGLTDEHLARLLDCTEKELGPVIGMLYRRGKVDRCREYVVLAPAKAKR